MNEILHILLPNVSAKPNEIIDATLQTVNMMVLSGAISLIFGLIFGVIVVVTSPRGILKNAVIYNIMDKLINVFRSIPFVILLAALIPFTRMVVGTAIGTKGAILPLVFGTVPFFTRQIESALYEVDKGLIEAAQSMGSSPIEIIFRVYLRESLPGIIRGVQITFISLLGLTAMAGAIGGGGLGNIAIQYGYYRYKADILWVTVIILVLLVQIFQFIGTLIALKLDRRHS